jgi:hypothetical protein
MLSKRFPYLITPAATRRKCRMTPILAPRIPGVAFCTSQSCISGAI